MSKCSYKVKGRQCGCKASIAFIKVNGLVGARCAEHAQIKPKVAYERVGKPCPCCDRGYIARYAHIDNGKCYKCKGTGIA